MQILRENHKADQLLIWRLCTSKHAVQTVKLDFVYVPQFLFYLFYLGNVHHHVLHAPNLKNVKLYLPFSKIHFIYIL